MAITALEESSSLSRQQQIISGVARNDSRPTSCVDFIIAFSAMNFDGDQYLATDEDTVMSGTGKSLDERDSVGIKFFGLTTKSRNDNFVGVAVEPYVK